MEITGEYLSARCKEVVTSDNFLSVWPFLLLFHVSFLNCFLGILKFKVILYLSEYSDLQVQFSFNDI